MHIVILAPSDRSFITKFLPAYDLNKLPIGYQGAPFIGNIISELLKKKASGYGNYHYHSCRR